MHRIEKTSPVITCAPTSKPATSSYRYYVLALLWLVALLRFLDLQILAVLMEPIKADFHLSDTQLALLGGLAFALFYGVLGLPVAWLADRYNRKNIISGSVILWSAMTALCGQATGFLSLFLARMGVGIGEAGAYPPTTSLLADYFPEKKRGRANAILASAIPAGVFAGFLIGGYVSHYWGWRAALQLVGLPGIIVGVLVFLCIREPQRVNLQANSHIRAKADIVGAIVALWMNRAYRHVIWGACLFTTGAVGSGMWMPSFFIRQHGLNSAEVGLWMALIYGFGGILGAFAGGYLAEQLSKKYGLVSGNARLCAYSLLMALPALPFLFLASATALALGALILMAFCMHMNSGPVLTQIQLLAGADNRALGHAVSVLISNLIALPLGPLFVGFCSDHLAGIFGTQTLGLAILTLLIICWSTAAWQFGKAAKAS